MIAISDTASAKPALLVLSLFALCAAAITDADWTALNSGGIYGASGPVYAEVYYKNRLYIGGDFIAVGNTLAKNVAQWDGSTWSALGSGVDSMVLALAVDSSGALYAGGTFSKAGGNSVPEIARWNGNSWAGLGSGTIIDNQTLAGPSVLSITVDHNGIVYAAGRFSVIAGVSASNIARWDGSSWSAIGDHLRIRGDINALAFDQRGNLYAGGEFDSVGGALVRCIARWNGVRWDSLGAGMRYNGYIAPVYALLCEDNGDLVAGGGFCSAGDTLAYYIARWDGTLWHSMGSGMPGSENAIGVYALAKSPTGALVASGTFPDADWDTSCSDIARWDGLKWNPLGIGFYDKVHLREEGHIVYRRIQALSFDNNGGLFAGGTFLSAGGNLMKSITHWDGGSWAPVGTTISGPVKDVVTAVLSDHRGNLYVGGSFEGGVARLSGDKWDTLGAGIRGTVLAMCLDSSGNIYAAGQFDSAGGHKAKNIAKWDGTKWSPLDLGMSPGSVRSLLCGSNGKIFAAGEFSSAGRVAAYCIAQWDGVEWDSLGNGLINSSGGSIVYGLDFDAGGSLVAGGNFIINKGNSSISYFARWNGEAWDSISGWNGGSSDKGIVSALAFDGRNNWYLSVAQTTDRSTGEVTRCAIVRFDGGTPQRLGTIIGRVSSLTLDRKGNLYAAGNFDSIILASGYVKARGVAKWNGGSWEALGSGIVGDGRALAVEDSTLFVGGKLFAAGAAWSPYIAKVNIHNFTPAVLPNKQALQELFRLHYSNAAFTLAGCQDGDEIFLYSLSGKLLKRIAFASRIVLRDLSVQMILVRVKRGAAILGSHKIMLE